MQARTWCLGALVFGALLVAVSLAIPWLFGPRSVWTEEKAQQHAQAAAKLHSLALRRGHAEAARQTGKTPAVPPHSHAHHDDEPPPTDDQVADARTQFDRTKTELEQAKASGRTTALVLRGVGVLCALCGGGGYLLLRRTQ